MPLIHGDVSPLVQGYAQLFNQRPVLHVEEAQGQKHQIDLQLELAARYFHGAQPGILLLRLPLHFVEMGLLYPGIIAPGELSRVH